MASQFNRQLDNWFQTRVLNVHRDNLVNKLVVPIHTGVVDWTPKDTGRASSGWTTVFNGRSSRNPGIPPSQSAGVSSSMQQLAEATRNPPSRIDYIIIMNNVPYVKYLNYGRNGRQWSFKAPLHYIEMTVERVARTAR